jgi:hypothetical protein
VLAGCTSADERPEKRNPGPEPSAPSIITFDLDRIDDNGLHGPPDGLRSVMYEFCIPTDSAHAREVRAIDPSLRLQPAAPGRIGCSSEQTLCIGDTYQPGWRRTLERLAALAYVERIDESFAE